MVGEAYFICTLGWPRLLLPPLLVCMSTCGVVSQRYNVDCLWPPDHHHARLDLERANDRWHLNNDALMAEDLAIRYADNLNGPRSGQFRSRNNYRAARDQCMATLFATVGQGHGVDPEAVRRAVGQRSVTFDAAVLLSFATLFGFMVRPVASRIAATFASSLTAQTLVVIFASIGVGIVGGLVGDVWSGVAETIRVGNGHVSYRVNRVPWRQHPELAVASCVALFWVIGALRVRALRLADQQTP